MNTVTYYQINIDVNNYRNKFLFDGNTIMEICIIFRFIYHLFLRRVIVTVVFGWKQKKTQVFEYTQISGKIVKNYVLGPFLSETSNHLLLMTLKTGKRCYSVRFGVVSNFYLHRYKVRWIYDWLLTILYF